MSLCDKCLEMFDTELMHDTQNLRLKLISEETKIIQFMDRIMSWLKFEKEANYLSHDCNHTQLRVFGPAKAKKFNITKPKANSKAKDKNVSTAKFKVKRLKSSPNKNSRTTKSSIQVEESSQLQPTIQDENIAMLKL